MFSTLMSLSFSQEKNLHFLSNSSSSFKAQSFGTFSFSSISSVFFIVFSTRARKSLSSHSLLILSTIFPKNRHNDCFSESRLSLTNSQICSEKLSRTSKSSHPLIHSSILSSLTSSYRSSISPVERNLVKFIITSCLLSKIIWILLRYLYAVRSNPFCPRAFILSICSFINFSGIFNSLFLSSSDIFRLLLTFSM